VATPGAVISLIGLALFVGVMLILSHHGNLRKQRQITERKLRFYEDREAQLRETARILRSVQEQLAREAQEPKL
jgi:hypothetical protein